MTVGKKDTQETVKDFFGDTADSTKKAFGDILDRKSDDLRSADWLTPVNPYQALTGLPGSVPRTVGTRPALGGAADPVAAPAGAALTPQAELTGGTARPGAADLAEGLAVLPQQIAQLSQLVATLLGVLENLQDGAGAVTGGGRAPVARKGT